MENKELESFQKKEMYRSKKLDILARVYQTTIEDLQKLFESQSVCPICQRPLSEVKVCIDHDHATNKVRGLLCNECNLGLGFFKDDPDRLRSALFYLERK
jgi:uncharacterized protein with PIN domain